MFKLNRIKALAFGMMAFAAISCGGLTAQCEAAEAQGNEIVMESAEAVSTKPLSVEAQAIVASLQAKGTPAENYKVSEAEPDIVIDAVAFVCGPND